MQNTRLITAYSLEDPTKQFIVCDVDEDRNFIDPLILFSQEFHDPYKINKEGLFAIGGHINTKYLIDAYKWGIFPWYPYKFSEEIYWYCPEERFVIYPDRVHISHSLRNLLNKQKYKITYNKCFDKVIHNCRYIDKRDENENAWLSNSLENSFIELNRMGYSKSVEVWEDNELIGGFYGFCQNGVFEGDSMFSFKPSASQVGLIELCRNPYIDGNKISIIDTQFETPTFKRLGGEYISYKKYREIMDLHI